MRDPQTGNVPADFPATTLGLIEKHVGQRGDHTALVDFRFGGFTWKQLAAVVAAAAEDLNRFDGQLPLVHRCNNDAPDVVLALAAACIGLTEAPIDARLPPEELTRREVELAGCLIGPGQKHAWFSKPRCFDCWDQLRSRSNRSSIVESSTGATILWTSGTTGLPRAVVQSHRSWLINASAKLNAVPQASGDRRLTVLPVSHAYARTCDIGTWLLSGCELAIGLGKKGLSQLSADIRPTIMNAVPSMAYQILREPLVEQGLDQLRLLGVGGAPLEHGAFDKYRRLGVTVIQGYGLTQTGPVIASATPHNAAAGLVGEFVDGWEWQINESELFVRGPSMMDGYWGDICSANQTDSSDLASHYVEACPCTGDGQRGEDWFATGDLVEWDQTVNQLRILGRKDDVIVLPNGIKLHPATIQQQVEQIDGLNHAVLVYSQDGLVLWIDGDSKRLPSIQDKLDAMGNHSSPAIQFFEDPLSFEAGELTAKGTVRRRHVIENRRLLDQAGSVPNH